MSHFRAPCPKKGFLRTGTRSAYAGSFLAIGTAYAERTPNRLRLRSILHGSNAFDSYFQLKELKESHQAALLNALKHPNADVEQLLKETEEKYKS